MDGSPWLSMREVVRELHARGHQAVVVAKTGYTWQLFVAGAFVNALPGIAIQLILIPVLVITLKKAGVIRE